MTKPASQPPVPGPTRQNAPPGSATGGPPPARPFTGANAGVGMGRPSGDDRAGPHDHDGWNSNT